MAGVVEQDSTTVVIKKEAESNPESPVNVDVQDSPPSQAETNGSLKHTKVWSEDETKSMLEVHKSFIQRFQDGSYSKKQLLEDVAQELNLIGYDTTPEKVRNKMKYLRARYKAMLEYNVKHVEKKVIPFQDELAELYNMPFFDDEPVINGNGSSDFNFRASKGLRTKKLAKSPTVPRFSLKNVLPKKKSSTVSKASKIIKKKAKAKRSGAPLFQCGICLNKFQSSSEMHVHNCKPPPVKMNNEIRKRIQQRPSSQSFHWNSLITMQFLDLLKDYQVNNKNSNFKRGNVWENITADMKRLGHKISVDELSKKWNVLSTNYQRTVAYNSTHRDKKKCAFFKRLMELHNHQPFNCFNEKQSAKQTVEVSPFSFSQASSSNISAMSLSPNFNNQKAFKEKAKQSNNSSSDLLDWLNNTWTEFKEMERQRREVENQRHNEIMEMLSYLIESKDKHH